MSRTEAQLPMQATVIDGPCFPCRANVSATSSTRHWPPQITAIARNQADRNTQKYSHSGSSTPAPPYMAR
jgi:hypothetical protein